MSHNHEDPQFLQNDTEMPPKTEGMTKHFVCFRDLDKPIHARRTVFYSYIELQKP